MKHAYLIHGWGGKPEGGFRPWLRDQLHAAGWAVTILKLPHSDFPIIAEWMLYTKETIQNPDSETLIVGHSLGGQVALRFAESISGISHIGKIILVAPVIQTVFGLTDGQKKIIHPWLVAPIDDEKVKKCCSNIVGFFSDTDRWIPKENMEFLKKRFNAKIIVESGMGHYNSESGIASVPAVYKEILM